MPCANLWLTVKFDGVEPQPTAVNVDGRPAHVEPASPCVVVGAHGELNLRRVPVREHTSNLIFAVCFCFVGCFVFYARHIGSSPCAHGELAVSGSGRNVNMRSRDEAATVKDGSRPLIFNSNSSAVNFVPKLALR